MPADELTAAGGREAPDAITVLAHGDLTVEGRLPWSSNVNFVVTAELDGRCERAVYKPGPGEQPLWDFPDGIYRREAAAFVLCDQLGWGFVPETIVRDGPFGEGSVQRFVDADHAQHFFTIRDQPRHHGVLQRICLFDAVSNQTDRKAGHCLWGRDDRIWAIDNALSFHTDPKLRTVIWDWAGEPIPEPLTAALAALVADGADPRLARLLDDAEIDALLARTRALVARGEFPSESTARHPYPWPLI